MRLTYRAAERFAMCSTFKLALAAAVLGRVDAGGVKLGQSVSFTRADLVAHSPVTEMHVNEGALPLETMLQAMVEVSDNTAANQLLAMIGGPAAYTQFLRGLGDRRTRLDRIEPALNSNGHGDPPDTTTPSAMLADMNRLLFGTVLSGQSSERLITWMRQCSNGQDRLRARLPAGGRLLTNPGRVRAGRSMTWPSFGRQTARRFWSPVIWTVRAVPSVSLVMRMHHGARRRLTATPEIRTPVRISPNSRDRPQCA